MDNQNFYKYEDNIAIFAENGKFLHLSQDILYASLKSRFEFQIARNVQLCYSYLRACHGVLQALYYVENTIKMLNIICHICILF